MGNVVEVDTLWTQVVQSGTLGAVSQINDSLSLSTKYAALIDYANATYKVVLKLGIFSLSPLTSGALFHAMVN